MLSPAICPQFVATPIPSFWLAAILGFCEGSGGSYFSLYMFDD
jgi:hypothetical protein